MVRVSMALVQFAEIDGCLQQWIVAAGIISVAFAINKLLLLAKQYIKRPDQERP